MLFLKRCSDVFEERRGRVVQGQVERGRSQAEAMRAPLTGKVRVKVPQETTA